MATTNLIWCIFNKASFFLNRQIYDFLTQKPPGPRHQLRGLQAGVLKEGLEPPPLKRTYNTEKKPRKEEAES